LVIAEAAWIDLARTAASRDAADATVVDEWRQIGRRVHGWRIFNGWQVQRRIVDGRRRQEQRSQEHRSQEDHRKEEDDGSKEHGPQEDDRQEDHGAQGDEAQDNRAQGHAEEHRTQIHRA
jgi:hypothetical protein